MLMALLRYLCFLLLEIDLAAMDFDGCSDDFSTEAIRSFEPRMHGTVLEQKVTKVTKVTKKGLRRDAFGALQFPPLCSSSTNASRRWVGTTLRFGSDGTPATPTMLDLRRATPGESRKSPTVFAKPFKLG